MNEKDKQCCTERQDIDQPIEDVVIPESVHRKAKELARALFGIAPAAEDVTPAEDPQTEIKDCM